MAKVRSFVLAAKKVKKRIISLLELGGRPWDRVWHAVESTNGLASFAGVLKPRVTFRRGCRPVRKVKTMDVLSVTSARCLESETSVRAISVDDGNHSLRSLSKNGDPIKIFRSKAYAAPARISRRSQ